MAGPRSKLLEGILYEIDPENGHGDSLDKFLIKVRQKGSRS